MIVTAQKIITGTSIKVKVSRMPQELNGGVLTGVRRSL